MRAVCSGTRQVLRGGINNAVSGFVMQRQAVPPPSILLPPLLLNRPNRRHERGPKMAWHRSFFPSISLSLSLSARVSFLLTYGRINAPSRSYLRRIVVRRDEILWRRIIDGDKRNFLLFFSFSFLFPREKFILYGIEHESDITVSFFSIASKSRYVREGYIIRDDYKFFLLLHVARCKCVAFF